MGRSGCEGSARSVCRWSQECRVGTCFERLSEERELSIWEGDEDGSDGEGCGAAALTTRTSRSGGKKDTGSPGALVVARA